MMTGNAEGALDRANGTADAGAHGTADHPADRSGDPAALVATLMGSFLDAADKALGPSGMGDGQQRQSEGCGGKHVPRGKAGWDSGRGHKPGVVHLGSLRRGAKAPPAGL